MGNSKDILKTVSSSYRHSLLALGIDWGDLTCKNFYASGGIWTQDVPLEKANMRRT